MGLISFDGLVLPFYIDSSIRKTYSEVVLIYTRDFRNKLLIWYLEDSYDALLGYIDTFHHQIFGLTEKIRYFDTLGFFPVDDTLNQLIFLDKNDLAVSTTYPNIIVLISLYLSYIAIVPDIQLSHLVAEKIKDSQFSIIAAAK